MSKVITIGEALIDFIPNEKGVSLKDIRSFIKKPGGAPANVAACVAKLGGNAQFIGKLGNDAFGDFLIETLNDIGVNTKGIVQTDEANTALAFVSLDETGDRDFSFYRNPSADMLYNESEVDESYFNSDDILHFCSVDLIDAPVKWAHIKAIKIMKEKNGIVCFDPNVRLPLWKNAKECRDTIIEFLNFADILKLSDEELLFITGIEHEDQAIKYIFIRYNPKLILLTKGAYGAIAYYKNNKIVVEGYQVDVVDTTGAGDAFIGSFLYQICGIVDLNSLDENDIKTAVIFSNKVGALTTTNKGAIEALPTMEDVEKFEF